MVDLREALKRAGVLVTATAACCVALVTLAPSSTETAAANGDTRTIHLFHTHTGETIDATFRVDGHYDTAVLRQLNHFLRDWRNNDEIDMDPRLFDAVWEAYRSAGASDRIQIYSAYRSPETNAMLRRRSRAVAEHSQHMLGKAMDTTMPGFPMDRVRDAGMKLQRGGVGWYPSANFVHLDVGGVRSWPRMPYDQLARLFPDGKTVHIPSNGQPLPGYELARQEIAARGGTDLPPAQESGGFFAWLFGGGNNSTVGAAREDEEDRRTAVAAAAPPPVQQRQAEPAPQQVAAQPEPAPQGAPLAYAEDTRGLDADPAGGQRRQEAALERSQPADILPVMAGVMPLPPRRPIELATIPADVPMPPVRPETLARNQTASIRFSDISNVPPRPDPIAGLITSTGSGVPMIRKSRLPSLITQGDGHKSVPHHVLSFAEVEPVAETPTRPMRPVSLRAAAQRAASKAPVGPAPKLMGLRAAAKLKAQRASL